MTAFVAAQPPARIAAVVIADAEQPDGRSLAGPPASTISVTDGSVTVLAVSTPPGPTCPTATTLALRSSWLRLALAFVTTLVEFDVVTWTRSHAGVCVSTVKLPSCASTTVPVTKGTSARDWPILGAFGGTDGPKDDGAGSAASMRTWVAASVWPDQVPCTTTREPSVMSLTVPLTGRVIAVEADVATVTG